MPGLLQVQGGYFRRCWNMQIVYSKTELRIRKKEETIIKVKIN